MDIGEVKVTERQQNAGPCVFRVQERAEHVTVRSGSMMAKISLCLGVLLIALVLELGGTAAREQRQVFAAEGEPLPEPTAQEREETLGALYYVEAGSPGPETAQEAAEVRRMLLRSAGGKAVPCYVFSAADDQGRTVEIAVRADNGKQFRIRVGAEG